MESPSTVYNITRYKIIFNHLPFYNQFHFMFSLICPRLKRVYKSMHKDIFLKSLVCNIIVSRLFEYCNEEKRSNNWLNETRYRFCSNVSKIKRETNG